MVKPSSKWIVIS
jgi:hypothetical protein